jgi:hypothetical protein
MAAWITTKRVETVVQTDLTNDPYVLELIDHAQGLAEAEIGTQDTPSRALQSVFAEIVARMWRAGRAAAANPAGFDSETTGPFAYSASSAAVGSGLGLTDREKAQLRAAVGKTGLWVQPLTRNSGLEMAPRSVDRPVVTEEQILQPDDGSEGVVWFAADDLPVQEP